MDRLLSEVAWWCAVALGVVPLVAQLFWYWNDVFFWCSLRLRALATGRPFGKLPPGHMGLPLLGEMHRFLWFFKVARRPDDYIASKRERYGEGVGLYKSHLFGCPTIISCSPASNKFILQSDDDFHIRWPSQELLGATSLASVHGTMHDRLRNFVIGAINSPAALRRITQVVQPRVVASLCSWAEKGTIRAFDETRKVTFENICKMFVSLEPGPLLDSLDKCFAGVTAGVRAYPINLPGTAFYHALKCRRHLNSVFRGELGKRKKRREEGSSEKEGETNDLMDGLMQVDNDSGEKLGDDEVVDNIVSLVIGGYESTTLAISWALHHLAKSPDVLRKLREENVAISEGKRGAFITLDDISQMKYTSKVAEETIRLANISVAAFRVACRDVDYGGYTIPKGWTVLVWLRSLHTDPRNFEDPLTFDPDRWNKPPKPGTFQVFGRGPRTCAGNMLARVQLAVFLHHLSVGYRYHLSDDRDATDVTVNVSLYKIWWELKNPEPKMRYLPHPRPVDGGLMTFQVLK